MNGRTDSPWYPTMRLFRQTLAQDWEPVVDAIRENLALLVARRQELQQRHRLVTA
jgi:hypothetical protein